MIRTDPAVTSRVEKITLVSNPRTIVMIFELRTAFSFRSILNSVLFVISTGRFVDCRPPLSIPRKQHRWLIHIPLHTNTHAPAASGCQPHRKVRLADQNVASWKPNPDALMLSVAASLNDHGTRLRLVKVDEL